jgi:hypothetical protein
MLYFRAILLNDRILSPDISISARLEPPFVSDLMLCLPCFCVGSRAFFRNACIACASKRPVIFAPRMDKATFLSFICSCSIDIFINPFHFFTIFAA